MTSLLELLVTLLFLAQVTLAYIVYRYFQHIENIVTVTYQNVYAISTEIREHHHYWDYERDELLQRVEDLQNIDRQLNNFAQRLRQNPEPTRPQVKQERNPTPGPSPSRETNADSSQEVDNAWRSQVLESSLEKCLPRSTEQKTSAVSHNCLHNPPHGSVFSNGLYRLDDRTLTFERVWRFADGSQESVPTNRFHDPSLTHNVSETVPPPRSRVSTSTGHRFLNKRLIEFNSQNGTWEYTSNSSGQPLENHYAVLDSEWADTGAQASSSGTSSTPTPPIPSSQPRPTTPLPRPQTPPRPKTPPPRSRTPVQNTPTQSIPPPNPQSQPSSSISTTQTNMSTNAKIELKTKFDGNANRVREITKHCDWKFALDPTTFDTNFKKSIYLLSCCEGGTAGPWAVEYSDTLDKASTATGAKVEDVFDWNKVKKAFIDYFSPVSQVSSAISAMRTLKQTGTVKEYVAAFRPLREQSNITEVAVLRDYFLDGLKDGLAYKIISIDPATIKTFEDLYGAAERLDEVYQSRPKKEQPSKTTYRPPVRYQSRGGRSFGRFKTIRRLTDNEREKMMKEGRCFRCRQVGHMARECPNGDSNHSHVRQVDTNTPADKVRAIINGLDDEAKKEAIESLENQGF
ncbi:hypothetical protein QCA50_011483 [Cerrena zonata]|uniref:CCHC-type domain-containing protein n=1 Tax=Cerrena zonata TaxID=2478898 RepID=A0AAW0FXQ0_9APHY